MDQVVNSPVSAPTGLVVLGSASVHLEERVYCVREVGSLMIMLS